VSFYNGLLNFTNWSGNVILPTLAGLFFALAILRFSQGQPYSQALYSGLPALMASGLLRALETFASQRAWNDPDVYWGSILSFVNWVCNVLMPIYAAVEVAAGGLALANGERLHHTGSWMRHFLAAGLCLLLSGIVRLGEYFVRQGVGGVK
jgi:hypothetical protein